MQDQSNEAHLRQLAAETIVGTSGLTDDLTDEEARPLIAWGLSQAEAAVQQAVATGQTVDMLPQDDLSPALAERLSPVRRVMKAINTLTADRHGLSPEEVAAELAHIQDLARKLPGPSPFAAADIVVGDLPVRQAGLDNSAFVAAILSMLGSASAARPQELERSVGAASQTAAGGEPAPQPQAPEQAAEPVPWWRRWAARLCRHHKNCNS
jgi:hypothetical protein